MIERKHKGGTLLQGITTASGSINTSNSAVALGGAGASGNLAVPSQSQEAPLADGTLSRGVSEVNENVSPVKRAQSSGKQSIDKQDGDFLPHKQKEELQFKADWIKMKRKVGSISDMHPATLNIDTIFNLSNTLKIVEDGSQQVWTSLEFAEMRRHRKEELVVNGDISEQEIADIFTDRMEYESQINGRDNIFHPATQSNN